MFQKYFNYVKDNPQHYWFRRKLWGWGWTPVTWQGFVVTFIYVGILIGMAIRVDSNSHSISDTLFGFIIPFIVGTAALIAICLLKGEKPKWQWGIPEKYDD